jgi:hypothetical protein
MFGGSREFVVTSSVAAACIYRGEPPRVTTSHNRLGLSIKHVLDTDVITDSVSLLNTY